MSTSGAHSHLKLNARNVNANAVTALFLIPSCARRVVSVAAIIAKPKPDDNAEKERRDRRRFDIRPYAFGNPPRQFRAIAADS